MAIDRALPGPDACSRPSARWWERGLGSPVVAPALLLMVTLAQRSLQGLAAPDGPAGIALLLMPLAGVAAGCAALAWVRPQRRGISRPHVMLSLSVVGMLLGLLFDLSQAGAAMLGALCASAGALDLVQALQWHARVLPGMHAGMIAGGLLAIPLLRRPRMHCHRTLCARFSQNLLCSTWMLAGMTFGGLWLSRWQAPLPSGALPGMLGGMFVGMTWGMVASVMPYRGFFVWRNRRQAGRRHPLLEQQ